MKSLSIKQADDLFLVNSLYKLNVQATVLSKIFFLFLKKNNYADSTGY